MKRSFIYLVVLTLLALAIVLFVAPEDHSSDNLAADALLIPGMADKVNEVSRIDIVTAGDQTIATLVKGEQQWTVDQMGGYRADWSKIQALLAALAQAKIVEAKTDKPEYYARLGVEDIGIANTDSVLVRFSANDEAGGILIGHAASGRQGQYVRLQGAPGSSLVDREFDVPTQTIDWADARIIDVNSSEVAEVEVFHPSSERVLVTRISADQTDFDMVGLPADRELKSSWAVNSLGSVFTVLDMEDVRPEDGVDWTDAVNLRLLMFSGVEILADLVQQDDEYFIRLKASHPAAAVVGEDSGEGETSDQQQINEQAAIDVANEVERINLKVSGWAYVIPQYKFEAMIKKPEDLLKPVEST
jgi:hypothetical protein